MPVVSASYTRPANSTAYTANDVEGATAAALSFPALGSPNGEVIINSASLEKDVAAVPSGQSGYRLYLYNVTPPSALADNAAHDIPSGDRASFVGYVDIGVPVDLGSTCYVRADGIGMQCRLGSTGGLFGYLVTSGAYTPGSGDVGVVTLAAVPI